MSEFSSIQFSHSVMSDSLRPHASQDARPPCPSPTPGVYSNPCPLSWWCHPTISSFIVPFFSCPQSFAASGSFPVSQLFVWGGQSTRVSASTSVLSMNTQDWSPLVLSMKICHSQLRPLIIFRVLNVFIWIFETFPYWIILLLKWLEMFSC